jgi:RNA polymerase sigma-B factor
MNVGLLERDALFNQYSYLCKRGSRKFFRGTVDRNDLEQTAAIGLLKACERFEASAGTPFEAYAWLMVVGELMHYVRDFERPVRIPRVLRRLDSQYAAVQSALTLRLQREPTIAETAAAMDVSVAVVDEVLALHGCPFVVPLDTTAPMVVRFDDELAVRDALAALTEDERTVVCATLHEGLTQREIGERLGYRQRRVSRILAQARKKLANALG